MQSKNWKHNPGGLKGFKCFSSLIIVWLALCQYIDFATATSTSTNNKYLEAIPGYGISQETSSKSCIAITGTIFHKRLQYNRIELIIKVRVYEQGRDTLPQWLSFNASTLTFYGVPLEEDVGCTNIFLDLAFEEDNWDLMQDIFTVCVKLTNSYISTYQDSIRKTDISSIEKDPILSLFLNPSCNLLNLSKEIFPKYCDVNATHFYLNLQLHGPNINTLSGVERIEWISSVSQHLKICPLYFLSEFSRGYIQANLEKEGPNISLLVACSSISKSSEKVNEIISNTNINLMDWSIDQKFWTSDSTTVLHRRRRQLSTESFISANVENEMMSEIISLPIKEITPTPVTDSIVNSMLTSTMILVSSTIEVPTMLTMTVSPSHDLLSASSSVPQFTELTATIGKSSDFPFELSSLFDMTVSAESLYIISSTATEISITDSGMDLATISTAKDIMDSMISTIQMISPSISYSTEFPETETIDFIATMSLLSDSLLTVSPYTPSKSISSKLLLISPSIFISTSLPDLSSIVSDSIDLTDFEFTSTLTESIFQSDSFEATLSTAEFGTPIYSIEMTETFDSTVFSDAELTISQIVQSRSLHDFTTAFMEQQTSVIGPSTSISSDSLDFTSLIFTNLDSSFLPTAVFTMTQSTVSSDIYLLSMSTAMMTNLDFSTESFEISDFMISNSMPDSLIASSTDALHTSVLDISSQLQRTILPTITTSLFLSDLLSMTVDSIAPTSSEFITTEEIDLYVTTMVLTDMPETFDFQSTILIDPTPVVTQVVTSSQFHLDSDLFTMEIETIDVTSHSFVVSTSVVPSIMSSPSFPPPPPLPPPPDIINISVVQPSMDMTTSVDDMFSDIIATETALVDEISPSEDFITFISSPFFTVDITEPSADLMITSVDKVASLSDVFGTQTSLEQFSSEDFTASMTSSFITLDMTSDMISIIDDTKNILTTIFATETFSSSEDFFATTSNSGFEGIEMESSAVFSTLTSTAIKFDNRFTSTIDEITSTGVLSSENSFEDPITTVLTLKSVLITPSSLDESFEISLGLESTQSIEITEIFMQETTSFDFTESELTISDLVTETSVLQDAVSVTDIIFTTIISTNMLNSLFPTNTPIIFPQSSIQFSNPMSILASTSTFDFAIHSTSSLDFNVQTTSMVMDIESEISFLASPSDVSILLSSSLISNSASTSQLIVFTPSIKEMVISSSKDTFPSSQIIFTSSGFVNSESSIDDSLTSTISIAVEPTPFFGPLLVNPLGVLVIDEGQPFHFEIPTTTFLSQGGSFDNFHISLYNGTNGDSLSPASWVQIVNNNVIEGLALATETKDGAINDHRFILRATNENGFSVNDTFVLRIIPQTSVENLIRVFIDGNFEEFSYNLTERLELAKALNGPSQKNEVFTQQFSNGSIAVVYANLSIDQISCSAYLGWFETIYSRNNYTAQFFEQLKPFQPIGMAESIGPCIDQQKQLTIVSIDPSVAFINSQETVTIFALIAAGALFCALILILTSVCICCSLKIRRPEQKSRKLFSNRKPVIFPGEIEAIPYRSRNTYFLQKENGYMSLLHQDDEEVDLNYVNDTYDEELVCIFPQQTVNDPTPTYKFSPQCLEKI